MATSHPLHPLAEKRIKALQRELEGGFGNTDSERKIVNALVYGATAAQTVGMLEAFAKARISYNASPEGQAHAAKTRSIGGR